MVPDTPRGENQPSQKHDPEWHFISRADTFDVLETHSNGLSSSEAERRQLKYGLNKLKEPTPIHPFWKLLAQFRDPMVYLLLTGVSDTRMAVFVVLLIIVAGTVLLR